MGKIFNYNFCKYAYDKKDYNFDRCRNCNKTCPTVSHVFYSRINKIPIIKQICGILSDIYYEMLNKKFKKEYIDEYETTKLKHIWGIKSYDDLSKMDDSLYSMNDFDLTYHKDTDDYSMSIETIYRFENDEGDKDYIKSILDEFTKWMNNNGYNTNEKIYLFEVFTQGKNINTHFKTIEDCYTYFKLLVNGYCSL